MTSRITRAVIGVALLAAAVLATDCARQGGRDTGPGARTVVDDLGRAVTLAHAPHRIVSLAPSITECVYFLGLDSLLVGVTDYCDYPPRARSKPRMGGIVNPNLEAVIGARPDLVLVSVEGNTRDAFSKLEQAGIPVFVTNPRDMRGVIKSLTDIASLCGASPEGVAAIDSLARLDAAARARPDTGAGPVVLMAVSVEPLIVAGDSTFIGEMLRLVHARNGASSLRGNYPVMSREEVVRRDPNVILIPTDIPLSVDEILARFPEWRGVRACITHRIIAVDANIFLRPGPRVFQGLSMLQSIVDDRRGAAPAVSTR